MIPIAVDERLVVIITRGDGRRFSGRIVRY